MNETSPPACVSCFRRSKRVRRVQSSCLVVGTYICMYIYVDRRGKDLPAEKTIMSLPSPMEE